MFSAFSLSSTSGHWAQSFTFSFIKIFKIDFRKREERGGERERASAPSICCSTYICTRWLLLVCALTGGRTCNQGVLGFCSNQLSSLARALLNIFIQTHPPSLVLWRDFYSPLSFRVSSQWGCTVAAIFSAKITLHFLNCQELF